MQIRKETIETLKVQGINVRWYPEQTYEEFYLRVWKNQYEKYVEYYIDNVEGSKVLQEGRTNKLFDSMEELQEKAKKHADRTTDFWCRPYEYTTLFIEHDNGQNLVKKENVKSKEITVEYVMKLVEKDRKVYAGTYGKFAMVMQKLCREQGLSNKFCVYPTTYGIGVWLFWNFNADKDIEKVEKIMKDRNIEYYNEYSDKMWVYRFKVSKKRENIAKMIA